ncbi:peptidoglycan-binding domain-containing protein [Lentzea sp. HUAS TT2]|uniref:peptidoglycan-binding domain-containing protein n=1 Tax=Lentzea sp. HUAS TT2 TaxID=3447454 RepID=UPI003F6F878D
MARKLVSLTLALLTGAITTAGVASATPRPAEEIGVLIRDCVDVPNRDVGLGDTGDYVREVQCLLNWAINPSTHARIAVDGRFGTATESKVKTFQRCANALGAGLVVDGRVGSRTAPHLEWWAGHSAYIC